MIQAKDLMIGNKVLNCDNEIVTVKELRDEFYLNEAGEGQYYKTSNGIPLTPEILEKCGFSHRLGVVNTIHEYFIGKNPVTHDWLFDLCYIDSFENKKYFYRNGHHTLSSLHQLQNLYFALTGEELNYTP